MTKNSGVSIDKTLFDWPSDSPHLKGSKCSDCEAVTFLLKMDARDAAVQIWRKYL